ncbi:FAD/NAD(P)-binding domain-containing protein [Pleurostoma richardsiae]|uniref:FAD/NAD(P)-binding domain-containing protein n=1 Tax=Pleurostoma richardsiae TaxID=41990 RepID=A0AA38VJ26_9PEZI|nr:FAD/NAD(P)-binding domain-containing protein [Pleurostoma richardsiae]
MGGDAGTTPPSWHALDLEEHPIDIPKSIKVVVVGAGITGINAAILLPAKVPGIELVVFERDPDVGGIWNQCIYPGVRCDVPSHVYQSTFSPSRDWSEHYAQGAEIKSYWAQVAAKYNAYRYIRLNHEVKSASWDEDRAKWAVTVQNSSDTWVEEADFFIMATGVFSHPQLPKYPGMTEYEGHLSHSSRWDPDFNPAGKRIAIIGNGSSGMQVLPQLQRVAARIDHYARSPAWIAGNFGGVDGQPGERIPEELRTAFSDPEAYLQYRKSIENRSFKGFGSIVKDGIQSQQSRAKFTELMRSRLGDHTDLLDAILPDFSPSCRRLTPGPGYLEALVEPNVEYITTPIEKFTKAGIRTVDGKERQVDAIVCCTGSEKSFAPPFPVIRGGLDLTSSWRPAGSIGFPYTYMGLAAPGFPNLLFVNGPQCASATGTLPFATENQLTLVARILRKASTQDIRTMAPTRQAADDFQAYCEAYFPRTVLSENCSSWFNGGVKGGRVIANWPGSGLHANAVRREPRWEDWEYTYRSVSGNRFAYFGNGWTQKDVQVNRNPQEEADLTPYLQLASVAGQVDLRGYHETWYDL